MKDVKAAASRVQAAIHARRDASASSTVGAVRPTASSAKRSPAATRRPPRWRLHRGPGSQLAVNHRRRVLSPGRRGRAVLSFR